MTVLSIPSPSSGVWDLGPIPIRGYALAIVLGIVVAVWAAERRWVARGGRAGEIQDIALWAVPFGLVGGRLYHVITDHDLYFGAGRNPWRAFAVWEGGLGVWGAIALGAVGALIGARRKGIRFWPLLDAIAPACLLAQGIGRWGNWFNQELYGKPTDLPWGLEIDPSKYPDGPDQFPAGTTFHPTFLYECLWDVAMFFAVTWVDRRFKLGGGRVLALYVMAYCLGRGAIETLRIDNVELHDVLGLRWSDWMAIILFVAAAVFFVWTTVRGRGKREASVYVDGRAPAESVAGTAESVDGTAESVGGTGESVDATESKPPRGD
ncbi:MAG: prolipoprotein diacylglyceryl transferase [Nocardioides sp.]|uniref:prolipoprotein diacylglyceryl transferase n=1 Tax=Nocardioides sp. TaxID=35761 RepID=UPI0039E3638B